MSRTVSVLALAALTLLAGCGGEKRPPVASGEWRPLAAGLWDIDPARVTVPPVPGE